jgi:sodium-dependent dicarboxylate transporter 2/3/5
MLFGGGFALAQGFQSSGLSEFLGSHLGFLGTLPVLPMMVVIALFITIVTNLTSNTATTTVMLPILAATALATRTPPLLLMLPATFAASAAFMLPVGTPPNAIIFGSGRITIPEMMRAGFLLTLLSAPIIAVMCWWLGPLMLG